MQLAAFVATDWRRTSCWARRQVHLFVLMVTILCFFIAATRLKFPEHCSYDAALSQKLFLLLCQHLTEELCLKVHFFLIYLAILHLHDLMLSCFVMLPWF